MKSFYGLAMILCLTAMPVLAQDQSATDAQQPANAEEIVSWMQSKLNLSQDQVTAVTPIVVKYFTRREQMRASMADGSADKDSIRIQMKLLKEDEKQELSQFLSAQQLDQWDQIQKGLRHRRSDQGNDANGTANKT